MVTLESNPLMPGRQGGFTLDSIAADAKTQVVAVGGTIAMTEARTLESQVIAGIRGGRTRVVLDLTGIADTGPGLLGALLRVRRGVTRVGGKLALVVDGPRLRARRNIAPGAAHRPDRRPRERARARAG